MILKSCKTNKFIDIQLQQWENVRFKSYNGSKI